MEDQNCIYFRWPVKDQNMFRCCMFEIAGKDYYLNDFHIEEHKLVEYDNGSVYIHLKLRLPDDCPKDEDHMFHFNRSNEKPYDDYLGEFHEYRNQNKD